MAGLLGLPQMGPIPPERPMAQAPGQASINGASLLQKLLDPSFAMPIASALMQRGQGNAANFGDAFGAAGQAMAQKAQTNKTLQHLRKEAPDLAADVDAGLPIGEAWKVYTEQRYAQKAQGLVNAGDGQIYDPSSKSWITAPGGGQKAPQVVELFDEASGQPYKATWDPATGKYQRVGGVKARTGMQLTTNPDGTVSLTEGPISNRPKLTEAEAKNAGFLERGQKALSVLSKLEKEGTSPMNKIYENIPVAGNYMRSESAQMYDQAKRDFVNAVLRRESGAVISDQEFANAEQQYFPQPGDGPKVIEQKRINREAAVKGFDIGAGQGVGLVSPPPKDEQGGGVIDYRDFFGAQ